jgi:hypothetical protein
MLKPLYQDPLSPILFNSPALLVTDEQKMYIREVLSLGASDEQFADKMYRAITHILTAGITKVPVVNTLTPASAEIGDPSFTLHVHGSNFDSGSKIYFNGIEEPTTLVSATEVTTGVNMPLWLAPAVVPVLVQNSNGTTSASMNFTFTDGVPAVLSTEAKTSVVKVK